MCSLAHKHLFFNLFLTLEIEHGGSEIGRIGGNNIDRSEHGPPLNRAEKHHPRLAQRDKDKDLTP
jgi:hypothetical protein